MQALVKKWGLKLRLVVPLVAKLVWKSAHELVCLWAKKLEAVKAFPSDSKLDWKSSDLELDWKSGCELEEVSAQQREGWWAKP